MNGVTIYVRQIAVHSRYGVLYGFEFDVVVRVPGYSHPLSNSRLREFEHGREAGRAARELSRAMGGAPIKYEPHPKAEEHRKEMRAWAASKRRAA